MTHEEIIQKVRDILNEHGGEDGVSISQDRVLFDDYISVAIPDAVVLLASKGYEVNVRSISDFTFEDGYVEYLKFISLLWAKDRAWKRPVTRLTDVNSNEFIMSRNEYTKPGVNSPIVYIYDGMLNEEPGETGPVKFVYNKAYDSAEGLAASAKEATAVCYMAAAIVMGFFGDDAGKQRLSDIATNMLQ